jgi:hypothetical protein
MPKHYGWPNEEPDFLTPEGNDLIAAYEHGYKRGLEDAAKIVEDKLKFNSCTCYFEAAAAIREKGKQ